MARRNHFFKAFLYCLWIFFLFRLFQKKKLRGWHEMACQRKSSHKDFFLQRRRLCFITQRPRLFSLSSFCKLASFFMFLIQRTQSQRPSGGFPGGSLHLCSSTVTHTHPLSSSSTLRAVFSSWDASLSGPPATLSPRQPKPSVAAAPGRRSVEQHQQPNQDLKKTNLVFSSKGIKIAEESKLQRGRRHGWPTPGSPGALPKPLEACDRALFYPSTREIGSCVLSIPEL